MGNEELENVGEMHAGPSSQPCGSGSQPISADAPPPSRRRRRRKRDRRSSTSSSSSSKSNGSDSSSDSKNMKDRRRSRRQKERGEKRAYRSERKIDELSKEVHDLREKLMSQNVGHVCDVGQNSCNECDVRSPQPASAADSDTVSGPPMFQLDIATKLKEPAMPKTSEYNLKQLHDLQLFDDKNWCELRYADTQKLYNNTPGFTDLEPNEEVKAYDTLRHLAYADKAYSALTLCLLKQRQALQTTLQDLLYWARDMETVNFDTLNDKMVALFSEGEFQKTSSDLLQLICGHRAEAIQMRRDGVLAHVKDPLTKTTLRKIPPSCHNFFNADAFTTALEKAGGVRKCFWPIQKRYAAGPASQAGPNKACNSCPSQGKKQHSLPSQGSNCRSCAHVSNAHATCTNTPPSQGVQNHNFLPQGPSGNWQTASNFQGNNFRGQNARAGQRPQNQRQQNRGDQKRSSSSSSYRGNNKRRRY